MAWLDDNPVSALLERREKGSAAWVPGLCLGGLTLVWLLAGLDRASLLEKTWPFGAEAAFAVLVALAAALLLVLPLERALREAGALDALRRGGALAEVLATRLRPRDLLDGLALNGLQRLARLGLPAALLLLLAAPALPAPLAAGGPRAAMLWMAALLVGFLAACYGLLLGVAWTGPRDRIEPRGLAWLLLASLPVAACLPPVQPGATVPLYLAGMLAMALVARAGALDGLVRVAREGSPAAPVRRSLHSWGQGSPLVEAARAREGSGAGPWLRRHAWFFGAVLLVGAAAGPRPEAVFWGLLLVLLPLQTWLAAQAAFRALAREALPERLVALQLTGLTSSEFASGLVGLAWRPRLVELAAVAPVLLASGDAAGVPIPAALGLLAGLAGLTVSAAHLGFLARSSEGDEPSRRVLLRSYAALLGAVALMAAQVSADVMAGEWRFAFPRSQAILVVLSLYLPVAAWAAVAILRPRSVDAYAHRPGRAGFTS